LQWPTCFFRQREEKEKERKKLLAGAPLRAIGKHVPHHHDASDRTLPRTIVIGSVWTSHAPPEG